MNTSVLILHITEAISFFKQNDIINGDCSDLTLCFQSYLALVYQAYSVALLITFFIHHILFINSSKFANVFIMFLTFFKFLFERF